MKEETFREGWDRILGAAMREALANDDDDTQTYVSQRKPWVGLTADEMQAAYLKIDSWSACVDFIEAKLKEKNHG